MLRWGEMPTREVLHIDGFDGSAQTPSGVIAIEGGTLRDVLDQLGARWHIEREEYEPKAREISTEAAECIAAYSRRDPDSVLAVFWRHHSLELEEFDTAEEAERFLEGGEEYDSLAGEAIVAGDEITVLD